MPQNAYIHQMQFEILWCLFLYFRGKSWKCYMHLIHDSSNFHLLSANKTPMESRGQTAEASVCLPRIAEDFKGVKKQRVKSSQAVNFFLKFAPLLNFEEIMQSIFIFSYQNAYQKESFWLNSIKYIWSFPVLPRFPFVL